ERRWKLNRGVTTLFVIVTFFCVFLFSGYLLLKRITEELADLFVTVPTYTKNIATILQHIEESYLIPLYVYISNLIPIQMMEDQSLTQFFIQKIKTNATHLIQQAMIFLSQLLSSFAYTSLILLFIVLATYFMTKDFEKMIRILQENIPKKVKRFIINIKDSAKQSTFGLIKAQIMIALITVIMSFLGLSIFRVDHLILITCAIFIIDLIPYVGIGALFVPWIMYEFFTDQYTLTIKLSLLYIVLIIVRQIIEPRLLANSLGIHPLVTIVILFISIKSFGAVGFIVTPLSLIILSSLYHARIIHYIARFIKEGYI